MNAPHVVNGERCCRGCGRIEKGPIAYLADCDQCEDGLVVTLGGEWPCDECVAGKILALRVERDVAVANMQAQSEAEQKQYDRAEALRSGLVEVAWHSETTAPYWFTETFARSMVPDAFPVYRLPDESPKGGA